MNHLVVLVKKNRSRALFLLGLLLIIGFGFGQRTYASVPPGSSNLLCHFLNLNCIVAPISNITKSATPPDLLSSSRQTTVRISFSVQGNLTQAEVEEVLRPEFTFADPINFNLTHNGANKALAASPEITANRQNARFNIGDLPGGQYLMNFDVLMGSSVADGSYEIEKDDANCTTGFNNYAGSAQIYFRDASTNPSCVKLANTSVLRRTPKITFNADAWIGNKPLEASNTIQIGPNTLIVSGKNSSQGISNYNLPTTGKVSWDSLESLMRQRVDRSVATRTAQIVPANRCPTSDVRTLYLDSQGDSPFTPGERLNRPKTWILNNCSFTLRNATFIGTGTILNITLSPTNAISYSGGVLNIFESLKPTTTTDTFGYISFRPSPTSGSAGQINLQGDADPENVALFTSGIIEMGGNSTSQSITRQVQLISRFLRFPPQSQMKNDIIFDRPAGLTRNIPPLFQQFSQPSGQEVP